MQPEIVLLLLRLLSAALLLGFFGVIGWILYQDLKATTEAAADQGRRRGSLRVIGSEAGEPVLDTLFPLQPVTSIGRARSSTIVLDDNYTSSEHVLITRRGDLWWLEDLGSRNGTQLNELPLEEPTVVSAGDVITVGVTSLKVEL